MEDRQSENPGRIKLTFDDGTVKYAALERADNPIVAGTPLNKNTLFNNKNAERYVADLPSEAFELLGKEWGGFMISAEDWSSELDNEGYYTQQIAVEGMSEKYSPIFSVVSAEASAVDDARDAFSVIERMTTFDGYVIFKATEIPKTDITIRIKGV